MIKKSKYATKYFLGSGVLQLISLGELKQYYMGSDSDVGSDASNTCYMVVTPRSRNTYLVVYSDFFIKFFDLLPVFILYYELFI